MACFYQKFYSYHKNQIYTLLCIKKIDTIIDSEGKVMASVVDSIRAVYIDNYSMLKLGFFSCIIYAIYTFVTGSKTLVFADYIFLIIISILYIGYACIIMHNRIHQNLETLPVVNPIKFLKISLKGVVVLLPYLGIGLPLVSFVVGLFNFDGVPQQIAIGIIQLLVVSITLTALILYSKDYSIKEGFAISRIMTGFQDVLVYMLLCVVLLCILNTFVAVPALYFAYSFFDIGPVFFFICIYLITMNLSIVADYLGQLWFDLDTRNNYYY